MDLAAHGLIPPPARRAVPGSPQTVAELLERPARETPEREALVGRHARYSYAELEREVERAACALLALGLRPGDRMAASIGNHTEIAVSFLASQRIGVLWVGINRVLAPPEKAFILADSGARVALADREMHAQLEPLLGELPGVERLIDAEPGDPASEWRERLERETGRTRPRLQIDPFAPAAIAYTSGTTGRPKGAVHSQHNMLLPGAIALHKGRSGPEVTQAVCLPLTILNLQILGPVLSAQAGSKCVLIDRMDAPGIAEWVRAERIVSLSSVPATFHDLLTDPEIDPGDLESLTQPGIGGANCPEEFRRLFKQRFGREVQIGYGLTEAPTSVTHTDPGQPPVEGCSGFVHPHQRLLILDDEGRELPAGETGEICVAPREDGPWAGVYTPMLGYWNRPEATSEVLRGGILHTGDVGCLDGRGQLFVKDRKTDMILRGGANVYSAEVERVLHQDPRVAACAVLGIPDERLGERVVAAVELEPGARAEAEEIRTHCRSQLARYKVPERVAFVERFPRNAMNKILKRELRGLFE